MENLRAIKYFSKKIVMRPQNKNVGITEIWSTNPETGLTRPKQFIVHKNVKYFLQQIVEK